MTSPDNPTVLIVTGLRDHVEAHWQTLLARRLPRVHGVPPMGREYLDCAARVAAIGYCFGGTGALELARSGADVLGVVSFHGGLDSPTPEDAK